MLYEELQEVEIQCEAFDGRLDLTVDRDGQVILRAAPDAVGATLTIWALIAGARNLGERELYDAALEAAELLRLPVSLS